MAYSGASSGANRTKIAAAKAAGSSLTPKHYLRILLHRKWLVIGVFLAVSAATFIISYNLPDLYSSDTLILVDPQKVPESYVKATVTGDVRNRLGTLSPQIPRAPRPRDIITT